MAQQTDATFEEMEEQKTVHIDKIAETLGSARTVDSFEWAAGELHVWIAHGMLHSETIEDLRFWGVEIDRIQFESNRVTFTRRD